MGAIRSSIMLKRLSRTGFHVVTPKGRCSLVGVLAGQTVVNPNSPAPIPRHQKSITQKFELQVNLVFICIFVNLLRIAGENINATMSNISPLL